MFSNSVPLCEEKTEDVKNDSWCLVAAHAEQIFDSAYHKLIFDLPSMLEMSFSKLAKSTVEFGCNVMIAEASYCGKSIGQSILMQVQLDAVLYLLQVGCRTLQGIYHYWFIVQNIRMAL